MQPIIVITLVMLLMSACTNAGESVSPIAMPTVPAPSGGDPNPGQQGNAFSCGSAGLTLWAKPLPDGQ